MPYHLDPSSLLQRPDDLAVYGNTSDFLDVAAGHRGGDEGDRRAGVVDPVPPCERGAGDEIAVLFGPWALFAWLRLIVGLVFPIIVSWMALQTARTRSMESATGLLYINVGSIAAGTILAAGVFFGAGLFL